MVAKILAPLNKRTSGRHFPVMNHPCNKLTVNIIHVPLFFLLAPIFVLRNTHGYPSVSIYSQSGVQDVISIFMSSMLRQELTRSLRTYR